MQESQELTLWSEDTLVSLLVLPGSEKAKQMTVTSGRKCSALYPNLGPLGLLVKMLLVMYPWDSMKCYLTWTVSTTPRNRLLYQLAVSTPRTDEIESFLWRTPEAGDCANRTFARNSRGEPKLSAQVKMWPTHRVGGSRSTLPAGVKHGDLAAVVGGQLNADWVEILMGFPIGWTDIDCDNPVPWPGWPAPLGAGNWPTVKSGSNRNSRKAIMGGHPNHPSKSDLSLEQAIECANGILPKELESWDELPARFKTLTNTGQYPYEPPRVITGQKNRAKRLKCLGNAVVPQQIYPIFAAIMAIEQGR